MMAGAPITRQRAIRRAWRADGLAPDSDRPPSRLILGKAIEPPDRGAPVMPKSAT